jgi:hypothetical protein
MVFTQPDRLRAAAGWLADQAIRHEPIDSCQRRVEMSDSSVVASGAAVLPADQVLTIAQADALRAYRDLSAYRIHLVLEEDGWHVDYQVKDPRHKGGGPHYVIDAHTGAILSKRYEQ